MAQLGGVSSLGEVCHYRVVPEVSFAQAPSREAVHILFPMDPDVGLSAPSPHQVCLHAAMLPTMMMTDKPAEL